MPTKLLNYECLHHAVQTILSSHITKNIKIETHKITILHVLFRMGVKPGISRYDKTD
jgi:hypothetical protein